MICAPCEHGEHGKCRAASAPGIRCACLLCWTPSRHAPQHGPQPEPTAGQVWESAWCDGGKIDRVVDGIAVFEEIAPGRGSYGKIAAMRAGDGFRCVSP